MSALEHEAAANGQPLEVVLEKEEESRDAQGAASSGGRLSDTSDEAGGEARGGCRHRGGALRVRACEEGEDGEGGEGEGFHDDPHRCI